MRKLLGIIAGLAVAYICIALFFDKSWSFYAATIGSGVAAGLIADNKHWIPGLALGIIEAISMLLMFVLCKGCDSQWMPGFYDYASVAIAAVCPLISAEITGRIMLYIRDNQAIR